MTTVYLGLGSNIGDRRSHLAHGVRRLDQEYGITGVSSVWETDPVGYAAQGRFLNLVARVETEAPPREVLETVRAIEGERGRERTFRNAPRTLDIDILLYGDLTMEEKGLTIPHPRMTGRTFVLVPLLELEPGLRDPRSGRAFAELAAAQPSEVAMQRTMAGKDLANEDA